MILNKQGKTLTSAHAFLIILTVAAIFLIGIISVGDEIATNDNAELDNDSYEYIASLKGINLSFYDVTATEIENPIFLKSNTSQGNPKDYSLEFQFAKEKGSPIENTIKGIYSLPSWIVYTVLRQPKNNWVIYVEILNWLYRLLIIYALIFFARGNPQ